MTRSPASDAFPRNPTVEDVEFLYSQLAQKSGKSNKIKGGKISKNLEVPGDSLWSHAQGLGRFSDFFFMTHSREDQQRGRIVIIDRKKAKVLNEIRTPHKGLNHAGGIQIVADSYAFVPLNGSNGCAIVAYDLSPVYSKKTADPKPITLNVDFKKTSAGSVGITHLPDGDGGYFYVMAVGRAKTINIYKSNSVPFTSSQCVFDWVFQHEFTDQSFEAINLFTQQDGRIFMIGMQSEQVSIGGFEIGAKDDYMKIFEIDIEQKSLSNLGRTHDVRIRHTKGMAANTKALKMIPGIGTVANGLAKGIAAHFRYASSVRVRSNGAFEVCVGQRNFDPGGDYFYNWIR